MVRQFAPRTPGTVAGVASERDVFVLQAAGDSSALIDFLDARGVSGKQLHAAAFGEAGDSTTVIVSRENLHDEDRLRRDLPRTVAAPVAVVDGLGAVSVVGAGINATYANVRRGASCLRAAGITSQGLATSSFRITWLVPGPALDDAVRALHREFLERPAPVVP